MTTESAETPAPAPTISEALARLRAHVPALVEVDTAAGKYFMRKMNGRDRFRLSTIRRAMAVDGVMFMPPALVVAFAILDETGEPLFEDIEEGYKFCNTLEDNLLAQLYHHALDTTGLGERALELAEKKSLSSQSSESGTNLPPS